LFLQAGAGDYHATFYIGPKDQKILGDLATYLDRTIDYGWAWVFAQPLFWVLDSIYDYVGNWGWSIILLTILVKMFLYPLSAASLRSMAKMRNLQPQLTRLKELYGDDRQKMSQEMMALYKKEKVNPAGGCLPMLLQFPIFISLYWVLFESYEIRHAPWLFWIQDLSTKDPYFVLPILMGGSMFPYAEASTNAHRSNASQYNAVYANSSYDIYARIPFWISSLLDNKQSALNGSTVVCQPTDENKFKSQTID
jgi:YidC/Oxa1 family membrane protein insertase